MSNLKNNAIVGYCMPFQDQMVFKRAHVEHKSFNANSLDEADFIISNFVKSNTFLSLKFSESTDAIEANDFFLKEYKDYETSFESYKNQFNKIKDAIKHDTLKKLVLSRVKFIRCQIDNPIALYERLLNAYPETFRYLIQIPNHGIWMGATPEYLLKAKSGHCQTVALAGTMPIENYKNENSWRSKEREEHGWIEKHIEQVLSQNNVSFQKSKIETISSGSVCHLKSTYKFDTTMNKEIIKQLHPGPAISGYPFDIASSYVQSIESHERSLYAGIIGPWENQQNFDLFVNLRCMALFNNGALLYLGGGIVADSVLEEEWEETELKAKTMERILS